MVIEKVKSFLPDSAKQTLKNIRNRKNNRCLLAEATAQGITKLHLACGPQVLTGWLNVDVARYPGALTMTMPAGLRVFPAESMSYVYCSHMLHYLDYPDEVLEFVRQIRRILRPGGAFRVVVPGIERIIHAYVADDREFFKEQAKHHPADCTTKLEHLICALSARQRDGIHKFGYDFETAKKLMELGGFRRVIESAFNESEFEPLRMDYRGKDLSLFFDAVK